MGFSNLRRLIILAALGLTSQAAVTPPRQSSPTAKTANAAGEILRYDFEGAVGTNVPDISGNGQNGTIVGGATVTDGILTFDGVDDYVQLPDNLLASLTDITIETKVLIESSQATPYFIFGIGNTVSGSGDGYLFTTGDPYRSSIALGNYQTEQTASSGSNLARGEWVYLTYTLADGTAAIYLDGVQVGETNVTTVPGDISSGFTTANYLGRSDYTSDNLLVGQMRSFAIYNRAMDAEEVFSRSGNTAAIAGVTLADPSQLKVDPILDQDNHTVVFGMLPGTDLTSLTPVFFTAENVTSSPASGTTVDLSSPIIYTLTTAGQTTAGQTTAQWTLSAVEMKSPILPGLFADPNIAVYNSTYYIYATTDGYASWGGNVFYIWSSPDLVQWTRSAQPFLTLNGTAGNVPWATGNAWAPTITERDGKYYFYFSGQNDAYGWKTIGAAVADSPDGPWTVEETAMITNTESVTTDQAIDPCAFADPVSGKYYLFWGNGDALFAELADDMVSLVNGSIGVISGLEDFREGQFVIYREGLYHLTYSIDDTGSEDYRVGYATAESVSGPWTYRGVILEKDPEQGILATGHNSIINVPGTDDWYIAYHRFQIPGGDGTHRETTIDRLEFGEDGFIVKVVPTLTSVEPQTVPAGA